MMSVTNKVTPPPPLQKTAKVGAHTHQCSKHNHQYDCQYSSKCHLELYPSAQAIIDHCCMACAMLDFGISVS